MLGFIKTLLGGAQKAPTEQQVRKRLDDLNKKLSVFTAKALETEEPTAEEIEYLATSDFLSEYYPSVVRTLSKEDSQVLQIMAQMLSEEIQKGQNTIGRTGSSILSKGLRALAVTRKVLYSAIQHEITKRRHLGRN